MIVNFSLSNNWMTCSNIFLIEVKWEQNKGKQAKLFIRPPEAEKNSLL